ncbi:MAG: hypothetical protein ACRBHB_22890 [Arenicella sp.]
MMVFDTTVFAQSNQYQCLAEPKSERLVYQSIAGVPSNFKPKPSRYVDSYSDRDVLIDVRNRFEISTEPAVRLTKALRIPLHALRAKTYLKQERLVLVGTGLDDYFLEQEVIKLKRDGFRSVKILQFGIVALLGTSELKVTSEESFQLRHVKAHDVVSASVGREQDFLFVNLGTSENKAFDLLGLKKDDLPFTSDKNFYNELFTLATESFEKNSNIRIVLVHDNTEVYQEIFSSRNMFDMLGMVFVEGGMNAIDSLQSQIAKTAVLSTKVKRTCSSIK